MNPSIATRLAQLAARFDEVEALLSREDATGDLDQYRRLTRERSELEPVVELWREHAAVGRAIGEARELLADADMRELAEGEIRAGEERRQAIEERLQVELLPRDPNDERNLFLEIRAGTGGDESALFAGDLFRMYARFAERCGWKVEVVSQSPSELGGYKEVIARIAGHGAYSRLKFESGGHRVQRVPATETQGRIHTSACTVAVLPEADEVSEVSLNPSELRIDTFRASGAGGQHVNKTDSAVRITHLPTNIVVQCQNDRSQHRNRDEAWAMLRSRLYEHEMRKQMEAQQKLEDSKTDVGWGHQIRSYVLDQSRIKDLRTGVEISNTQKVLDGDLDTFITASLKQGL